jgi:hypothetical protein
MRKSACLFGITLTRFLQPKRVRCDRRGRIQQRLQRLWIVFDGREWDAVLRYVHLSFFLCSLGDSLFLFHIYCRRSVVSTLDSPPPNTRTPPQDRSHSFLGGDCSLWMDASTWNETTKAGIKQFALASMDATQDWFFWTWKVCPPHLPRGSFI